MQAVLYVAHGSRVKAGIQEAYRFVEKVKVKTGVKIQELCFLELAEPSISQGIKNCMLKGATSIAVVPIFLFSANHMKYDFPKAINQVKKHYPQVPITLGKPFGVHEKLVNSIQSRILEKKENHKEIDVLLIGRGSSDPKIQMEFQHIANRLKEKYHYRNVDICFLYGKGPLFDEKLEELKNRKNPVLIVPYLLFTGRLHIGIQKKLENQRDTKEPIILCDCLGYDENVQQVLIERVKETLSLIKESA
jgi:sirohydrochlorin ferrochelatase